MTRKKINLPSRYNEIVSSLEDTLVPFTFDLKTNSNSIRVMFKENSKDIQAIDLEGGPFISVGNTDLLEGYTLDEIVEIKEQFKFIFKKNEDKG